MRSYYQVLILLCLLSSSSAQAAELFAQALYWRASESADWVYLNSNTTPNQTISYKTISFDYAPGFRVGVLYGNDWDAKLYMTKYYTSTNDSASGNLVSGFLGARIARPTGVLFYNTGQVNFKIDYSMYDCDIGKRFNITDSLMLHPLVGVRGGWINQTINTRFQGVNSVTEDLKNNFSGIGPKAGIETRVTFLQSNDYKLNLVVDFDVAYLWGHWVLDDYLQDASSFPVNNSSRNFGALALQGLIGASLDYKKLNMSLGYEINDWFNQYQINDNDTGPRNNELVLQGLTFNVAYRF